MNDYNNEAPLVRPVKGLVRLFYKYRKEDNNHFSHTSLEVEARQEIIIIKLGVCG